MSNDKDTLKNLRICAQKILPHHINQVSNLHKSDSPHAGKLLAAFWSQKVWPAGKKITIGFLNDGENIKRTSTNQLKNRGEGFLDPLQEQIDKMSTKEAIKKIVRERIEPLVNLKLEFVDTNPENADVRIMFDPNSGCSSSVGTDCLSLKPKKDDPKGGKPTMNFAWLDVPTVIHEFGHMLGMIHEHQNPRGQKIQWNDKKVIEWAKDTQGWDEKITRENILNKYNISLLNGSSFDPLSIMLYFFPAELTTNNMGTKQNLRMSGLDVEWIHKTYPKQGGETPEQFYKHVYGNDISNSIQESDKISKKIGSGGVYSNQYNNKNTLYYILIIICVILITLFIIFISKNIQGFFTKSRKTGNRYGR